MILSLLTTSIGLSFFATANTTLVNKSTSIDRVVVTMFTYEGKSKKLKKEWDTHKSQFQYWLTSELNAKSYLEAEARDTRSTVDEKKKEVKREARESGVDGVVVGSYQGDTIEAALKSGTSGRTLAQWTIPLEQSLSEERFKKAALQLTKAIVTRFPYMGLVIKRSGNEVLLNLGKKQALKKGTRLEVFEFSDPSQGFTSAKYSLGIVVIKKTGQEKAIGKILRGRDKISPYSKVAFIVGSEAEAWETATETRTHDSFWLAPFTEFVFLDTQVSENTAALNKRIYQLSLSPFVGVELGFRGLQVSAMTGGATNESNKVRFIQGQATVELFDFSSGKLGQIFSFGGFFSNYNTTPNEGASLPLTSVTTYSPLIEHRFQFATSPTTRLWLAGQFSYPVFSEDIDNGKSQASSSFAGGAQAGIRIDFSDTWALTSAVKTRYTRINLVSGAGIIETQHGFSVHLLFTL